jgi:hypothetical protein
MTRSNARSGSHCLKRTNGAAIISEIAKIAGLSKVGLRHYEDMGLHPARRAGASIANTIPR